MCVKYVIIEWIIIGTIKNSITACKSLKELHVDWNLTHPDDAIEKAFEFKDTMIEILRGSPQLEVFRIEIYEEKLMFLFYLQMAFVETGTPEQINRKKFYINGTLRESGKSKL